MPYEGDYIIVGPPGTGKTHRVAQSVASVKRSGLTPAVMSYTVAAAREASGRTDLPRSQCGTMHAMALAALGRPALVLGPQLRGWGADFPQYSLSGVGQQAEGPIDVAAGASLGDRLLQQYHLNRAKMVPREQWGVDVAEFAGKWDGWKAKNDLHDWTDLIENAALDTSGPAGGRVDVLLVDEAQDLSALENSMVDKWGRGGVRAVIRVGDPQQALYTWRGADPQRFCSYNVAEGRRDVLGQSFRVPRAVHRVATAWVRQLSDWEQDDYQPRDHEGSVKFLPATLRHPHNVVRVVEDELAAGRTVQIQASCSYMLPTTIKMLKSAGIPLANPWRSAAWAWNPFARATGMGGTISDMISAGQREKPFSIKQIQAWVKLVKSKGTVRRGMKTVIDQEVAFVGDADRWLDADEIKLLLEPEAGDSLISAVGSANSENAIMEWLRPRVMEKRSGMADYVMAVIGSRGLRSVDIDDVYADPSIGGRAVFVGTVHSFKGSEADTVIIFPDLSSAGYKAYHLGRDRDSVVRQFYVGLTRSKDKVFICEPTSGARSVPLMSFSEAGVG